MQLAYCRLRGSSTATGRELLYKCPIRHSYSFRFRGPPSPDTPASTQTYAPSQANVTNRLGPRPHPPSLTANNLNTPPASHPHVRSTLPAYPRPVALRQVPAPDSNPRLPPALQMRSHIIKASRPTHRPAARAFTHRLIAAHTYKFARSACAPGSNPLRTESATLGDGGGDRGWVWGGSD